MLLAIPFLSFLTSLLSAYGLMRAGRAGGLAGLCAGLAAMGGWVLWCEGAAVGLDVFLYTFAFWGAVVPALAALVPGAALGWLAREDAPAAPWGPLSGVRP